MQSPDPRFKFLNVSGVKQLKRYRGSIQDVVTPNSKTSFEYLLYENPKSYAFCIMEKDKIVAFQGYVYKPFLLGNETIPTYRSEFTIAKKQLRGTGLFPEFYKQTMQTIISDEGRAYIWGQTGHRGFLKYGYEMHKKYSFYQVFSSKQKAQAQLPALFNKKPLDSLFRAYSRFNPARYLKTTTSVQNRDSISFEEFKRYESKAIKPKLRLFLDQELFHWRYTHNSFEDYRFITHQESLIIIKVTGSTAEVVDVYAANKHEYATLISYLTRQFDTVIMFGNIWAHYKLPFFWINLSFGFVPLLFGGSYVEYNKHAPDVRLKDNQRWSPDLGQDVKVDLTV